MGMLLELLDETIIFFFAFVNPTDERIFVIFVVLGSCGIFGYSLNSIGEMIKELEREK